MRKPLGAVTALVAAALLGAAAPAPSRVQRFTIDTDVQPDGTYVQAVHLEIAADTDGAAQREAQLPILFSDAIETVEVGEAYTLKPDGRRIPVPAGSIVTRLAPGIPNLPMFTDRQQKMVLFPDARGGDVFVIDWKRHVTAPIFPGEFTQTTVFVRTMAWTDVDVTATVPPGLRLQTEDHGAAMDESAASDGRHRYHWHFASPEPLTADPAMLLPIDRAPRLFASTFDGWPDFSRAYFAEFAPKIAVTNPVQVLADEITRGTTDPREQVDLLYTWMAQHIRWGAIYLGNGPWVPHAAAEVIENGMGDCKDQVTLFVALLAAKGINAEPVLINLGASYTLSGPAVAGAFNHVITYIPSLTLYADTTAQGPLGTLPFPEYGKPILHVTAAGSAPGRMPVLAPETAFESLRTTMRLDDKGVISGTSSTEATGPWVIALMADRRNVEASGAERAAAALLKQRNSLGQGRFNLDQASRAKLGGEFVLEAHPDYLTGEAFRIPTGLRVLTKVDDFLLGPLSRRDLPESEATPCYPGHAEEDLSLALPPGLRPERLPRDTAISGSQFRYESAWRFADGVVSVHRSLVSTVDQPLCSGSLRREVHAARSGIARDADRTITLTAE